MKSFSEIIWLALKYLLIFMAVMVLFGELLLRILPGALVGELGPKKANVEFYDFGPWFTPNQRFRFSKSCYSTYPITVNSFGMRDRERKLKSPRGTTRIAVLGDSFMEALQVPDGQYATALIERDLVKLGNKVEVLNFGFSGYGTAQQLFLYRKKVRDFHADHVIVVVLPSNDVRNNSMKLDYKSYGFELEDYGSQSVVPFAYFDLIENELIERPNLRKNSELKSFLKKWVSHQSYLADFLHQKFLYIRNLVATVKLSNVYKQLNTIKLANEQNNTGDRVKAPNTRTSKSEKKLNEATQDWGEAWMLTEKIFDTFRDEVESNGAKFAIAIIDHGMEEHRRLIKMAEKLNITYIDLGPEMKLLMKKEGLSSNYDLGYPCDAHWNAVGHRIMSVVMTNWLNKILKQ